MTDIPNPESIQTIPDFMTAIADTFGVEVPVTLVPNHPLFALWEETAIAVTESTPPEPRYSGTGDMATVFPFDFAQSAENPPEMNLKIEVFQPPPPTVNPRGLKVTVFPVPKSAAHPHGVIVKRGFGESVDAAGNLVAANPSIVPPEAAVDLDRLDQP
ncbi:MAG: hypothetical protein F6K00_20865 [Leptolyngbya sp. SIOISBB]|nr:hypothetical protein [Leptolyngbya sp. SIOISBB]